MVVTVYSPYYLMHPETRRQLDEKEIKDVEFDPLLAPSEYRSYKSEFLDLRPAGEATEIRSSVMEINRVRSADNKQAFLVWTERQYFNDNLGNPIETNRNYCGMYRIPKTRGKTVPDGKGSIKTEHSLIGWTTLYEIPFNEENANKLRSMAENEATLKLILSTHDNEEVWGMGIADWEKWLKWDHDALLDYCRTPIKFRNSDTDTNKERINPLEQSQQQEPTRIKARGTAK